MGLKYTKRAMTSYEVHRFFHDLEISFFPDTFTCAISLLRRRPFARMNQHNGLDQAFLLK